jgi:hypothetical protein
VHACVSCPGRTRHRGPCAACRRRGVTLVGDQLLVPITHGTPWESLRLLTAPPANPAAPTVAELQAGVDLTPMLAWHGTDCPCPTCAGDRIPGRYA